MRETLVAVIVAACQSTSAFAGTLTVKLTGEGVPLKNAVVSLYAAKTPPRTPLTPREMDQRGLNFQPHVLAVQAGSEVLFPNSDNTRHQVYSFSPAKTFELPLYSGTKAKPILLGTPGVVELGCNIHDWMLGYIVVLDTPYFAVTDANGRVTLQAPAGSYRLDVWHELQTAPTNQRTSQQVSLTDANKTLQVEIQVKPAQSQQQPVDERLRDLQQKFRNIKSGK
ncbi:MAG: methylamine utilization protein [Thermomonas sp.]